MAHCPIRPATLRTDDEEKITRERTQESGLSTAGSNACTPAHKLRNASRHMFARHRRMLRVRLICYRLSICLVSSTFKLQRLPHHKRRLAIPSGLTHSAVQCHVHPVFWNIQSDAVTLSRSERCGRPRSPQFQQKTIDVFSTMHVCPLFFEALTTPQKKSQILIRVSSLLYASLQTTRDPNSSNLSKGTTQCPAPTPRGFIARASDLLIQP